MRWLCILAALPAAAHIDSLSTGELVIAGVAATYVLKVPAYEVEHVTNPGAALPDAIVLAGAVRIARNCSLGGTVYTCRTQWRFDAPPSQVTVRVRLDEITVPNHMHALTAVRDGVYERAVFDSRCREAVLRFEHASGSHHVRWLPSVLAALALGLAAASWREFLSFAAAGAIATFLTAPAALIDLAVPVAAGYVCFEALYAPVGRLRWLATGALGLAVALHGPSAAIQASVLAAALPLAFLRAGWKKPLRAAVLAVALCIVVLLR